MQPWTSEEHLVNEELLEEAHAAFASNFKPEAWFDRSIALSWQNVLNCTLCHFTKSSSLSNPMSARRSQASLLAEAHLAKQLKWKIQLSAGYLPLELKDLVETCKKIVEVTQEKIWLDTHPVTGSDIDVLKPYLAGINAPLETVNKGVRKRMYPATAMRQFLTMFDNATKLRKGVTIMLGMGETLNDIPELHHFIEMNHIDKITFSPVIPHKNTPIKKSPSSFYMTRWIAETRIAFPKAEIIAGTWKGRVAEVGLFLKAGANAITKFPAVKRFNSEDAKSIEQEMITAKRNFLSTLTNMDKILELKDIVVDMETKDKLLKYIQTIQERK